MRKSRVLAIAVLCLLAVSCLLPVSASAAFVNYATINRGTNWNPFCDPDSENVGDDQNLSSDGSKTVQGTMPTAKCGYDSGTGNVYFYVLLDANPFSLNKGSWLWDGTTGVAVFLDSKDAINPTVNSPQNFCVQVNGNNKTPSYAELDLFVGNGTGGSLIEPYNIPIGSITMSAGGGLNVTGTTWTDSTGYLTVTDLGPNGLGDGQHLVSVEWSVPLAWFNTGTYISATNPAIYSNTPIRAFYGTSVEPNSINKDYLGTGTAIDFTQTALFTFGNTGVCGIMYDTHDSAPTGPSPPDSGGTWSVGSTVSVNGYGWPTASASLNVRIKNPSGTVVWSGAVSASSGIVSSASTWSIPVNAALGTYSIEVQYPTTATWTFYDNFVVASLPTTVTVSKTVSPSPTTLATNDVVYTIIVNNTGVNTAYITQIADTMSPGFSYVTGTTSGTLGVTSNPSGTPGPTLTWTPTAPSTAWTLNAGSSATLIFHATPNSARGTYNNVSVSVTGANFTVSPLSNAAPVQVIAPVMSMSKNADKTSAKPGDTITYTITYSNTGDANAVSLVFLDNIPANTAYVTGSTSGAGTTIQWSHDGGTTWNNSDAAPVTGIKWTISPLAPSAGGNLSFKVNVN